MIVKVCGVTISDQFNWLDQQHIDMIGLNFFKQSKRYVRQSLKRPLYSEYAKKVGVFVNSPLDYLMDKIKTYGLDMVQLHGNESVGYCQEVSAYIPIIKAFGIDNAFSFSTTKNYLNYTKMLLFDTKSLTHGGSGKKFNWARLMDYQYDQPFLLSGGICLEDIPEILKIKHQSLAGIDVNSGFELSSGIKDLPKISKMLNLIKSDESR
jgi:phosphoribosylanthranilate isomerase